MIASAKILITITRTLVGILFIFSGLVKADDPLGLSYKMQEFFGGLELPLARPFYAGLLHSDDRI